MVVLPASMYTLQTGTTLEPISQFKFVSLSIPLFNLCPLPIVVYMHFNLQKLRHDYI